MDGQKNGVIMLSQIEAYTAYKALKHYLTYVSTGADYEDARRLRKEIKETFKFK